MDKRKRLMGEWVGVFKKIFDIFKSRPEPSQNVHVLVVDDDKTTCRLIESTLTKRGFRVSTANTAEQSLEIVRKDKPQVMFLDCLLPDVNGVEVGRRIKKNPATKDIILFFLTVLDTPKNILDCYELGAENYLVKPISPSALISQVKASLKDSNLL